MKYYKIIQDNNFIGVCRSTDFIKYQSRNHLFVQSDEIKGQFVECKGKTYRSNWMSPIPNDNQLLFEEATIIEIDENQYDIFKSADIVQAQRIIQEEEEQIIIPIPKEPEVDIEWLRSSKLNEMSSICHKTIEQGFDLDLRGETKHFSLDTQDQLNLMSLGAMLQSQSMIPYHADGEEVVFYSAEEIQEIIDTANAFKIYHTTYYNSLKNYINSLETIEEIAAIEYGVDIPEEYQSDVLKALGR